MNHSRENQPQRHAQVFPFHEGVDREQNRENRERARVHVLIENVESRAGDRQSQKRRNHNHAAPAALPTREALGRNAKARQKEQEYGREVPKKKSPIERKMSDFRGSSDQVREKSQMGVRFEEFLSEWIVRRMQDLHYPGHINLSIFGERVIAVDEDSKE